MGSDRKTPYDATATAPDGGDDDPGPIAGSLVLFVGTVGLLAAFVMLRSGEVPIGLWGVLATIWGGGTLIKLAEIDNGVSVL